MPNLFSSFKIKNIEIKNRIVLPPLVRFSKVGKDGYVTEDLLDWYHDIAVGGTGLIIVEATCVASDGKLRDNQIGIWDDSFIEGLSKISKIGKQNGVPMLLQLHHAGFKDGLTSVSSSCLDEILEQFILAFKRAKKANFDGVEIHGAHGYLLSQLNSRIFNTRADRYGGSFEKRMFFNRTLIEKTKELFDDNFILGYRMGGNEPYLEDGIEIAKYLESLGVDLLHISSGIPDPSKKQEVKIDIPKDFPLDWVIFMGTEIRKHVTIPVIGVRKIKREDQASYLIENNLLDFVAVGRAMIGRPNWPKHIEKDFLKRIGRSDLK